MSDTTNYRNRPRAKRSPIWLLPDEDFIRLIADNMTYAGCLGHFGFQNKGNNWHTLKKRIEALGIDTSHFEAQNAASMRLITVPPGDVLVEASPHTGSMARRKFRQIGTVPYECDICGQGTTWHDRPLVLILDHRNGRNRDHRPENLRWLCPNCNSQTDTFAGRNKREIPSASYDLAPVENDRCW